MKTKLFLQLGLLTALFAACATSDDEELTSQQNQKRGMVKAEFTIAFPQTTTRGATRLSPDIVQVPDASNGNKIPFRGIKGIELYPFSDLATAVGYETNVPETKIQLYGTGTAAVSPNGVSGAEDNTIAAEGALYTGSSSHLYQNVDIPIGTKSFIFYGEAQTTATQEAWETGKLNKNATGTTLAGITFSPAPIFSGSSVGSNGTTIAQYMTDIANTQVTIGTTSKAWKDTPNAGLRSLYENFTAIKTGAWANVKAAVQVTYDNLEPRDGDNDETKAMKKAIRASIAPAPAVGETEGEENSYGVKVTITQDADNKNVYTLSFSEDKDYSNYPADLYLPDGAAYILWDASNSKFVPQTSDANIGLNIPALSNFVFPASLYYFVKSNIKTSGKHKTEFDDSEDWTTITSDTNYELGTEVDSKTRSIVITNPVQYGVGRLDITVTCAGSLQDYKGNDILLTKTEGEGDAAVTTSLFPITGILVGNQKAVDFEFHQVTDASAPKYTIYDNQVTDGGKKYLSTNTTSPIHTLVLETAEYANADDANAKVPIAIECQNNSDSKFVGYNGEYVFPGCKFYLVGTLNPYKGESDTYKKAFMQDYTTTANLTINSLANAHSTLPDLDSPNLELGVSVDLNWTPGVTYSVVIE